ncbi:Short C-terminal domain-containing protein [Chishuiella changwenlii]|uniref:Short C-terminal domain-containing protein n=1 Tax=Chishuiella changwenlii TaxID=1434701 RepID=A0A1M6UTN6_9FLAO|nr:SHOCT domain-containing protein [Chishuiella changwenlii]GGF08028.1 hypothetical protein GCM10010984_26510 [Chishuiella changwenlii]SHK72466.1 Short C-terminal domain-containing protein [Chishuiella changwenlii]
MNLITQFKGQNGKILVYDDYIELSKDTFGGFISQGGYSGNRRYFYSDIVTIEYKKPTFIANGYFKIIIEGTTESNATVGLFASSSNSMKDQNTIILRAFTKKVGEETDSIFKLLMQKISEFKKSQNTPVNPISKMDELKKLGELKSLGIITEEEFQVEKQKLLNS